MFNKPNTTVKQKKKFSFYKIIKILKNILEIVKLIKDILLG